MTYRIALGLLLAATMTASAARAAGPVRRIVPSGGGLDALDVEVDAARGVVRVRRCKAPDCAGAGAPKELPIALDMSRIDAAASTIEVVAVGEGRQVARVRVPDAQRKDVTFEALLSGRSEEPIFAGLTGFSEGQEGERRGRMVLIHDRDATSNFIVVADSREDTRICGQAATPLGPRGIDVATMELRGATLHRIDKKTRDAAERVIARGRTPTAGASPLARVLVATGGSGTSPASLTDGDADTLWSESRPGDGHGEFVAMRVPSELPVTSLLVTVAPSKPKPEGAAPRTFFVAMDDRLLRVTMPEDAWSKPGQAYEIALPAPVRTTCLAIVLDEAFARGAAAPEVSIAEVAALTKFDAEGATLADVARALSTPRADEAAALLRRAGKEGLTAVTGEYPKLESRGRALAVDVASSAGTCDGPAAELLTQALADADREVRRRALGRIERCGKAAADALVLAVRSDDEARRRAAAPLLASVAPSQAALPLADQMGKGTPETRRAIRGAFVRAAAAATRDTLAALLSRRELSAVVRLDLLRATGARLADLRPEADALIADLLRESPAMATRYVLAEPIAHLARAPGATSEELSRLTALALADPAPAVRARAVELAAGVAPLAPTLVAAAADPEPRVRESAFHAMGLTAGVAGARAAADASKKDEWTFVRMAALQALGALPQSPLSTNALAAAVEDPSPKVRLSALSALGKHRLTAQAGRVRERLDDAAEDVDVRALAARTLGVMCVKDAADRLTKLALRSRTPVDEADVKIGMAAIDALAALHPADLAARLAPLRAKGVGIPVRLAADRALRAPGTCL